MSVIPEIKTEEEYDKLLARLVEGAKYLENPLIKPEDYDRGMEIYNQLERQILAYKEKWSEEK